MFGFLNINKPTGMTSHQVISVLRKITGIKRIGHAGTLDPLAQGVLPVAIGKASKLIDYMPQDKAYCVTMRLGYTSDTFDTDGTIKKNDCKKITLEEINSVLNNFIGEVQQVPPAYSAVHYNGKRLYELARKGQIPDDIPKRDITIYKNEIVDFNYDEQVLKLYIECSKGTYIRTIVNDLGTILGSGAVMTELIRTKSSAMVLANSFELSENITVKDIEENLINPLTVIKLPVYEVNEEEYKKILNGNKFNNRIGLNGNILLTKADKVISIAIAEPSVVKPEKLLL